MPGWPYCSIPRAPREETLQDTVFKGRNLAAFSAHSQVKNNLPAYYFLRR